jgi:hypothetical protein
MEAIGYSRRGVQPEVAPKDPRGTYASYRRGFFGPGPMV